jgi:hypothetical protein
MTYSHFHDFPGLKEVIFQFHDFPKLSRMHRHLAIGTQRGKPDCAGKWAMQLHQRLQMTFNDVGYYCHVQRVSAKHGVKDDFAFLWEHAIFRHPPNKNPLTDRSEILHN